MVAVAEGWLATIGQSVKEWRRAARTNADGIKQARMLPVWLPITFILFHFVLVGLCVRYSRALSPTGLAAASMLLYFCVLTVATITLLWSCKHYQVSGEALGIRPSNMRSDLRWSSRICALGAFAITVAIVIAFVAALALGIRLPVPPASYVHVLGGDWSDPQFLAIAGLGGAIATFLAPVTEELIYRSLFLPPLTHRLGLYPAIVVTSLVFGLAHVVPFGQITIPLPEIVGGLLMAAGFAIRWSIVPAMVIHAMGNLVAGTLALVYVRLFIAYPTLFVVQ
jgi:membrane protease YdiL (CAAX protease family)